MGVVVGNTRFLSLAGGLVATAVDNVACAGCVGANVNTSAIAPRGDDVRAMINTASSSNSPISPAEAMGNARGA